MQTKTGVLLVNLGTPNAPTIKDVHRYLTEFLTDERVIDYPWLWRQLLVRGVIIPSRIRQSTHLYEKLWTSQGSPLMVHGREVENKLQESLGHAYTVKLAMRYQNPSIQSAIESLLQNPLDHLIILPLFPQYASATTGSVHQKVMEILKDKLTFPKITFIDSFADHPLMIKAFVEISKSYNPQTFDHVIFSFHGLPERQIRKSDSFGVCGTNNCCQAKCQKNIGCYKAQCYTTARDLVKALNLNPNQYSVSFQSRLGKEPWIEPYTTDIIQNLAKHGKKRVLVFCPAFVCDCLETTIEIGYEYANEFRNSGGETLQLVEGLNSHPLWIEALKDIVTKTRL
jgi:protoporphyrin/coproporphyrin ferrochelatase